MDTFGENDDACNELESCNAISKDSSIGFECSSLSWSFIDMIGETGSDSYAIASMSSVTGKCDPVSREVLAIGSVS